MPKSPLIRYGQWIVIPVLLLLGLEKAFKHWTTAREQGYVTALSAPPPTHVDGIFIGISHVFAAIDTNVFDARVSSALGKPFNSLNMGGGQRSLAMHYLGIRDLLQKYPDQFKGCTVFLEAPFDMPERRTWNDPWYFPDAEKNVIRVMHSEDLPRMLASEHDLNRKLTIYGLWVENHSNFVSYRALLRWHLIDKCESVALRVTEKAHLLHEDKEDALDVQSGGTMRTDALAFKIGHDTAVKYVADELENQKPTFWNTTILADLHKLVIQNGGQLVLFEMPKHSMFAPPYKTAVRQKDAKTLNATLVEWHTPLLKPVFSYTDSDFPDSWHLRRSLRASYTTQLADAWLRSLKMSSVQAR